MRYRKFYSTVSSSSPLRLEFSSPFFSSTQHIWWHQRKAEEFSLPAESLMYFDQSSSIRMKTVVRSQIRAVPCVTHIHEEKLTSGTWPSVLTRGRWGRDIESKPIWIDCNMYQERKHSYELIRNMLSSQDFLWDNFNVSASRRNSSTEEGSSSVLEVLSLVCLGTAGLHST